jgi:hypothetical protein
MKNIRNILIGIIIGFLLSTTVFAAVQEYTLKQSECKIVVDGVEVKGELPLLIMDPGFNYIPAAEFRSICDKIGVGFEFDVPTKEVRIITKNAIEEKGADSVSEFITQTTDGYKVYKYQGNYYVRWGELKSKAKSLGLLFEIRNGQFIFMDNDKKPVFTIPLISIFSTNDCVTYEDYVNIVLPALEDISH